MIKFTPQESLNLAGSFVACGLISILGYITWALVNVAIPDANANALTLLIGILSANVGMVVGYFFGSSVNNKKQTEAIAAMAETAKTAGVALGAVAFPPSGWIPHPTQPGYWLSPATGETLSEAELRARPAVVPLQPGDSVTVAADPQ